MKQVSAVLATLIILLFAGTLVAQGQNILVTKGVDGRNVIPRVAVNSSTGDVVVVWTHNNLDTGNVTVKARYLKRRNNGTYRAKKRYDVSTASGFNANGHIVYIPWRDRFLVTWDTYRFSQGLVPATIMGRELKKKGKPRKSPFEIISSNFANNWPRVLMIQSDDSSTAQPVEHLILTWTALPTASGQTGGVMARILKGKKYKASGTQYSLMTINVAGATPKPSLDLRISDLNRTAFTSDSTAGRRWGIVQVHERPRDDSRPVRNQYTWLLLDEAGIDSTGLFANLEGDGAGVIIPEPANNDDAVATYGEPRSSLFVNSTFQAEFTRDAFIGDLDGYLLIGKGGDIDGSYLPRNYDSEATDFPNQNNDLPVLFDTPDGSGISADDNRVGQFVFTDNSSIRTQSLRFKNGEYDFQKKSVVRVGHDGQLAWLEAEGVPGTSAVVIVWQKNLPDGTAEIWMHVFS